MAADYSMFSVRMHAQGPRGEHISGAEGIYPESSVLAACEAYARRALRHPKGSPERVSLSVERLAVAPIRLKALRLRTLKCSSPEEASAIVKAALRLTGEGWIVEDLDSHNGVYVGGKRVQTHLVGPGEKICIGKVNIIKWMT